MIIPTAAMAALAVQFGLPPTMIPPARFDHPHEYRVIWVNDEEMIHECRTLNASGCSHGPTTGVCVMWIKKSLRGTWIAPYVIRHEEAHCNGWPANHPA